VNTRDTTADRQDLVTLNPKFFHHLEKVSKTRLA
jgi:hypothetical protein